MIIECISDLHGFYPKLPGGDLLIVAGDYTASDKLMQWGEFFNWLSQQPYEKKVLIGGNHDNFLQSAFPTTQKEADELKEVQDFLDEDINFEYLCDSGTEYNGLKIWGSPWTKTFKGINPHCCAFTVDTNEELEEKWELIPDDTDILITHCPPNGILDFARIAKDHVGSRSLRNHVIGRIKPRIHIYGHIHEWGGNLVDLVTTKFINASHVNEVYDPVNAPIRVVL